jgi:hypothetical protein
MSDLGSNLPQRYTSAATALYRAAMDMQQLYSMRQKYLVDLIALDMLDPAMVEQYQRELKQNDAQRALLDGTKRAAVHILGTRQAGTIK